MAGNVQTLLVCWSSSYAKASLCVLISQICSGFFSDCGKCLPLLYHLSVLTSEPGSSPVFLLKAPSLRLWPVSLEGGKAQPGGRRDITGQSELHLPAVSPLTLYPGRFC